MLLKFCNLVLRTKYLNIRFIFSHIPSFLPTFSSRFSLSLSLYITTALFISFFFTSYLYLYFICFYFSPSFNQCYSPPSFAIYLFLSIFSFELLCPTCSLSVTLLFNHVFLILFLRLFTLLQRCLS